MATFSPAPAPRRSSRFQNRGISPVRSQRRLGATPTYISINEPVSPSGSAMDIDERGSIMSDRSLSKLGGETIFAKTNEMTVLFYATLPLEVKQVLRISDFNKDPYSGEIDTVTGFALVTSVQTCFVWQHAQAIKGIPTCYIFSCPRDSEFFSPPFHTLVPQGFSREPGLILVSPAGQIRFWDSIGIGLAGGDNFVSYQLEDMEEDEEVTNLVRANAQTYILSTSYGRLYRLILTSVGGKYHLTIRGFGRPSGKGTFTRFLQPLFYPSSSSYNVKDQNKHIHAVALGSESQSGDREAWVLANGTIQLWSLKAEGWEELMLEHDLTKLLLESLQAEKLGLTKDDSQDVELSDLAIFDNGNIAVLISYSADSTSNDFRRFYALAELKSSPSGFSVRRLHSVPYQTTSKPGPPVHPRIQPIFSGSIISVQFGDAVALCGRESGYGDRLELKSSNDRTLGVGVSLTSDSLLILTASTMMKVNLDLEKIQGFNPATGKSGLIKSTMMQAILYGASPLNPLRFSFPPVVNQDALQQAAQQLSDEVLRSDPEVVRQSPDMTAQMAGRKERLSWLIGYINEHDVRTQMSQTARQRLAIDAEKLYSSNQLWQHYNHFLSSSPSQNVLKDAVIAYMEEIGEGDHEDPVRAFFRARIADIGKVLKKVVDVVKNNKISNNINLNEQLAEAGRVIVTVLKSAFEYRNYNLNIYGIELPIIQPWSSRPSIIEALLSLFDMTTKAVESNPDHEPNIEPNVRLPDLAAVLFQSVKDRLDWLYTSPEQTREMEELVQRFSVLRPEVLDTLRRCGHEQAAFELAEKYHDYASLVALCHKDTVYPPENNPHAERIQLYIHTFKEDFVVALFQWYIQHGEVRTMFDQQAPGSNYLDYYFSNHPDGVISWINDLGKGRHSPAASALLADAAAATNLESKHLMLSIGKLSYLASVQETNDLGDDMLDVFHSGLDFVSVHEELTTELRGALLSSRTRLSIEAQIDTIVGAKCTGLAGMNGFIQIFKDIVRQLLQGKALSVEDIVELLTLKDNIDTVEDYATAINLITNAESLPDARRQSAIRTVWRRVYLHDDWDALKQTADISDEQINARFKTTALYSTYYSVLSIDRALLVGPEEALALPSTEEIVSRWPGISLDQVDDIIHDYETEADRLDNYKLKDVVTRIVELAKADT